MCPPAVSGAGIDVLNGYGYSDGTVSKPNKPCPDSHELSSNPLGYHAVPRSVPELSYFQELFMSKSGTTVLVTFVTEIVPPFKTGFGPPAVGCPKFTSVSLPLGLRPCETSVCCGPYAISSMMLRSGAERMMIPTSGFSLKLRWSAPCPASPSATNATYPVGAIKLSGA